MRLIILEKTIDVVDCIDDLNTVNLEENVQYHKVGEGVKITGFIDIEGEYICKGQQKQFKDKLNIDLLAPYDELMDKNAIMLKINDFDYINGGNKIIFTFKLNVEGWKEISKTFLSTDVSQENEEEPILIESSKDPEIINKLKELIGECKKIDKKEECISEYLKHGLEEVEKIIENSNLNQENIKEEEDRNNLMEFNITGEDKKIEKIELDSGESLNENCDINIQQNDSEEFPIKIIESEEQELKIPQINKQNQDSLKNLFNKKNTKVSFCSYRVVYEGETYDSIANEEQISVYDLKRFNKNKTLKEGILLKIPLKK